MQATLSNWRGSPRKFNEYLRAVRGLHALEAANRLKFLTSPYAQALSKLILSAVANACEDSSIAPTNLVLKEATVGRAMFLKRVCFRGRGRTGRVTKFGSNVRVILANSAADSTQAPVKASKSKGVAKDVSKDVSKAMSAAKADAKKTTKGAK